MPPLRPEGACRSRRRFLPREPFSEEQVRNICKAMQEQPGLQEWYQTLNPNRRSLRFRRLGVDIQGISQKLEDLSPAADVHATRFVNRMESAKIRIDVSSRSNDNAAINAARRVEDFYYAFVNEMLRQRPGGVMSPYRRHLDDMAAYGAGFLHPVLKPSVREEIGAAGLTSEEDLVAAAKKAFSDGFQENPFLVECPRLGSVFFEENLSAMCEVGERTVSQVLLAYDNLTYKKDAGFEWLASDTFPEYDGSDWSDTVSFYHLETAKFIYDVLERPEADGDLFLLEARPNAAGRPWYSLTPGHVNNEPNPALMYQPLIAAVYPTVQIMNVTRTLIQSGALNTGRPMYQEVADSGKSMTGPEIMAQPMEQRPTILFDPSEQVLKKPRKGYHWELVPAPSMEWLINAYEQSKQDLQNWGYPVGLSPESPTTGSADTGIRGAQEMEIATNYLDPALTNVGKALHELLTLVGDAIKGLDLPVSIPMHKRSEGGDSRVREIVKVQPGDFRDQDFTVELSSIPATAQVARRESNVRLLQLKLMSRTKFLMEENDDWLAEEERIQLDSAKVIAEQRALETVDKFITDQQPLLAAQVAAEQGIPLPPDYVPQEGGAAPGEPARFARPSQGSVPGAGSPNPNPEQAGPMGVPASIGTAQVAQGQ